MKFEDLRLIHGYPVQLQSMVMVEQSQRFSCRFVGCLPGHSILVTQPRVENGKRLRSGQKLIVRMMVANGIYSFATSIESVVNIPFPILHLAYPDHANFKQIRSATRVDVRLPIRVRNLTSLEEREGEGIIADISTTGARIEIRSDVVGVGDQIAINATVTIGSLKRELAIQSIVRSRIERSTREYLENLPAVYGVEFKEADDDNQLILYGYVYSEIAKSLQPE